MDLVIYTIAGVALTLAIASLIAPVRVGYTESVMIDAPVANVFDDIRLQEHLMRWSAWPEATRSTCSVEGQDGTVGCRTIYYTKGKRVGYQEIVGLRENQEIVFTLKGPGPPHRPELAFELTSHGPALTEVKAHFTNDLRRPFNIIWQVAGLSKWTREMHRRDLAGLKAFAEPPHLDSRQEIVGRPPIGLNPYEQGAAA